MKNTIKSLITIGAALIALCVAAETNVDATAGSPINGSVNAGYTTHYIVNGLSKTDGEPFAGLNVGTTYFGVDTYLGGVVLPAINGLDESHWNFGVGKKFEVTETVGLRFDLSVWRHQSAIIGGRNSIELTPKIALHNNIVTPYMRGSYDFNIEQAGYIVGLERATDVFGWVTVTPTVEYGKFTDYDTVAVKLAVSRTFFGHLEPFAEVGWYDNDFSPTKYNIATREFSGDVIAFGGLRWKF